MASVWVLPPDLIDEIDNRANVLGVDAFPHNGHLHFYSGPSFQVFRLIAGDAKTNQDRAVIWAKDHGATIIEDTPIGKWLDKYEGVGTFNYFRANPRIPDADKDPAGLAPWKHLSHLYALSAHGQITTTVAGASRRGVYYTIELPNTLMPSYMGLTAKQFLDDLSAKRTKPVEAINLVAFDRILNVRDTKGVEGAHTLIQLGEQRMALQEALETSRPSTIRQALKLASKEVLRSPAEAYKYFLESQERYQIDRALQMKGTKAADDFLTHKTPDVRQRRREERLDQFTSKVLLLIETEIALMPIADRPDFIVPPYVKTRAPR